METPCSVVQTEADTLLVRFEQPVRAITPGQAVVLYDGDTVIGGEPLFGLTRSAKLTEHRKETAMKRRIVAALLALGIPLTLLTSCGSKNAADQFFDTLKSIHGLKDYHIELSHQFR